MKTTLLICFAIALFLSLIKKRRARQYESDVKENSDFTNKRAPHILFVLSLPTSFGIQYYIGCEKDNFSACSQNIEDAVLFQNKERAEYAIENSIAKFNITEVDISEVENYFFPFSNYNNEMVAMPESSNLSPEPTSFDQEIFNNWAAMPSTSRTDDVCLTLTRQELFDFAEYYHKAKS